MIKRFALGLLIAVGLALAGSSGWFLARTAAPASSGEPDVSAGLSSLQFARLDGTWWRTRDELGSVAVLDFWATWCGPCRAQARVIDLVQEEFSGRNVKFLGVNLGEDAAVVARALREAPPPYEVVLDPMQHTSERTGIVNLPTLVVLDREGGVSWIRVGLTGRKELSAAIQRALEASPSDAEAAGSTVELAAPLR